MIVLIAVSNNYKRRKTNESQREHRTITLSFRRRDRGSSKKISKTYRRTDRTCRCEKSHQTFLGQSTMSPNQKEEHVEISYDPQTNFKHVTLKSSLLTDEDIHELWKILGRIADDPNNPVDPSQDAEIFIGYYE